MSLTPYPIEQFGGLNLVDDPFEVGALGATDLLDVDLDIPGIVRTRPGRAYVTSNDSATFSDQISRIVVPNVRGTSSAHVRELALSTLKFAEYEGSTVTTAALTASTGLRVDALNVGGATDLVSDDTGVRTWDAGANTLSAAIAFSPKAPYLGYKPDSGRVVAASGDSAAYNPDRVTFFDSGALTLTSTNWVEVEKGREWITGVATLGNTVFVFKETRAYLFGGESTDASGGPVFNYRPLDLGDRIRTQAAGNSAGRFSSDGQYVYFVATRGVYRMNEAGVQLISGPISPVFRNEVSGFTGFDDYLSFTCATDDRVYVGGSSASKVLVFDKATGQWSAYGFGATAMAPASEPRSVYAAVSGARLALLSPATTTDLGNAITWSWKSGRYSLADPGHVAVSRESSLVGSGTVTLRLDSDLYSNQSASATLGTAPAFAEGWPAPVDQEGHWLQYTLSWSGAGAVNRLTHFVSSVKPPGIG